MPNGGNFIPPSQRPDGTWRKPRRVKEGYVPQEEVPLYESKGKQFLNRKLQIPENLPETITPHHTIPGYFVDDKPKKLINKPKKEKKQKVKDPVEEVSKTLTKVKIVEAPASLDPAKRLKNLRKRLREIEALEQKIHSGDLKGPEKEQLDKVARKKEVVREIRILESSLEQE